MNHFITTKIIAACALSATATASFCQVTQPGPPSQPVLVGNAWVRAAVAGQQGTGAFMTLTAKAATRLVGLSTPAAGVAEVHEMKMEGDVMKMRALPGLDLPAGKPVQLRSGGLHIMLMDLKQPLTKGGTVPMTLLFKDAKGVESRVDVKLPVDVSMPGSITAPKAVEQDHGAHKH